MKLVIQRVLRSSVSVEGEVVGRIGAGLVLLLGVEEGDTVQQAKQLSAKVLKIRLWPDLKDPSKHWGSSVVENGYELLIVSQFTLFATFKKPKPDFRRAMGGDQARTLYEAFVDHCRAGYRADRVGTGVFAAMMQVELCNDGPVTVELTAQADSPQVTGVATVSESRVTQTGSAPETLEDVAPAACGAALEKKLESQAYVVGHVPSRADAELFEWLRVREAPTTPHLRRRFDHVSSFTALERACWS